MYLHSIQFVPQIVERGSLTDIQHRRPAPTLGIGVTHQYCGNRKPMSDNDFRAAFPAVDGKRELLLALSEDALSG
jgi:hypothetical protein